MSVVSEQSHKKPNFCNDEQEAYLKELNDQGVIHTEGLSEEKVAEIKRELSKLGEGGYDELECLSPAKNPLLTCTPTQEQAIEDLYQDLAEKRLPISSEEYNQLKEILTIRNFLREKSQCQIITPETRAQLNSIGLPSSMRFSSISPDKDRQAQETRGFLPQDHWEKGLSQSPLDKAGKIASIELKNSPQQKTAMALYDLLEELRFDNLAQIVHPEIYGKKTLYDYDSQLTFKELADRLKKFPEFSEREKLALLLFKYGKVLTQAELQLVFGKKSGKDLIGKLTKLGILTACEKKGETVYRLRDLSITSYQLPNDEVAYLIHDLPRNYFRIDGKEPTAQISSTSYELLNRLLDGKHVNSDKFQGVSVDFGSGVGIQAISLLKQYPKIQEALAVEIDPHAMNLSRFNAMMNGVADRFVVVDNQEPLAGPPSNFEKALNGRKIDIAVSNPPFNVVPPDFKNQFTSFGYGGEYGIDVAKIFWEQALDKMAVGASFISYGYLALDQNNETFATKELRKLSQAKGLPLNVTQFSIPGLDHFYNNLGGLEDYAYSYVGYIRDHITGVEAEAWKATRREVHIKNFAQGLKSSGIESIAPYFSIITIKTEGEFEVEEKKETNP